MLAYFAAMIIDNVLGTTFKSTNPVTGLPQNLGYGWCYVLVALGLILPSISVMVRRLHDTNHSGWWYWIILPTLGLGAILLLVWFCSRGTVGFNRYGDDPLHDGLAETFS